MPAFATADAHDSKKKETSRPGPAASGGRKPVKQIIIWTGIICVIALLINWNVSRLQTTAKSGRGGGTVHSSVSAQGDSQCISPHNGDTPTAVCQAFCNEKFMKFHCKWCKCRACSFCPKGGEAIEEAAKSSGNASADAGNASAAITNASAASAPPAAMSNATGAAYTSSVGELGSLLAVSGAGGSTGTGASTETTTAANATAGDAGVSAAAAATGGGNGTVAGSADGTVGGERPPAEATVTGAATAEAAGAQASANGAAVPAAEQPPSQTPEEAGAAYAATVQEEEAGGEDVLLDEGVGDADADLGVAEA